MIMIRHLWAFVLVSTLIWTSPPRHAAAQSPATQPAAPDMTVQSVKIQGSLDLENGVPIRWRKPDGSGYVNVFMMDKNGTLQLCHDPFYFEQLKPEKSKTKDKDEKE